VKLLLLLFGGLKLGKIGLSAGSMLLSLAIYAGIWGWRYAAGFIALLFAHEMGHFVAARQRGLSVGAPTFIPFMGAWIKLKDQPMNAETEAYVGIAGPFVGTLAAFAVYFLARAQDSGLLLAVAYSGFFLNLFNLLPISPLDGGRITGILSPRVWLIGAPMMIALTLYMPSPALIMIAILALPQLKKAWNFDPQAPENQRYYGTATSAKIEYGVLYLGLSAVLALMTYSIHESLSVARAGYGGG
jgi:Zn-dependent protease